MHLVLAENALKKRIFDVLENKLSATHGDWVTLFSSCIKMPKQEFHSLNVAQICSTLSLPTYYHLVACLFECQKNLYLLRSVSWVRPTIIKAQRKKRRWKPKQEKQKQSENINLPSELCLLLLLFLSFSFLSNTMFFCCFIVEVTLCDHFDAGSNKLPKPNDNNSEIHCLGI